MPTQKYFEDFVPGERQITSGRTMTEADIRLFIGASDNTHPVHVDREYCRRHPAVDDCVVQGCLVLGAVDGFMAREVLPADVPVLHYGYDKVRFIKPVYPGDTVHCETVLMEKRIRDERFGVICWEINVFNQRGETVLFAVDRQYVARNQRAERSYPD